MYYDDSYRNSRISLGSILLLIIFVSAAALIVTAIVWRPWSTSDTSVSPPVAAQQSDTTGDNAAAADPNAVPADPNAPQGP